MLPLPIPSQRYTALACYNSGQEPLFTGSPSLYHGYPAVPESRLDCGLGPVDDQAVPWVRQVLHRLIAHLDTTSIAEIVVRLVGAEEQTGMYLAPTQVCRSWFPALTLSNLS